MPELSVNPFIAAGPELDIFRGLIMSLFGVSGPAMTMDEDLTTQFMLLIQAHSAVFTGDPLTGRHACLWELARFIQGAYGVDQPIDVTVGETACGHESCTVNHVAEATFIEAAVRGDAVALHGVAKATMAEAKTMRQDYLPGLTPEDNLSMLFIAAFRRFLYLMMDQADS